MDTEGTGFQSSLRKRIRSDSDTGDEEMFDLYLQSLNSRKVSSSVLNSRAQVAEEMEKRRKQYKECSVPIIYAGFRGLNVFLGWI